MANTGVISTVVGCCFDEGYSGDGGVATLAQVAHPNQITSTTTGDIYFAVCIF